MTAHNQHQDSNAVTPEKQEQTSLQDASFSSQGVHLASLASLFYTEHDEEVLMHLLQAVQTIPQESIDRNERIRLIGGVIRCQHHQDPYVREFATRVLSDWSAQDVAPLLIFLRKEQDTDPLVAEDAERLFRSQSSALKSLYENTGRRMKFFTSYAKKTDAKYIDDEHPLSREQLDELSLMMLADPDASVRRDMAYMLSRHVKHLSEENRDRLLVYGLYGLQDPDVAADVKKAILYIMDASGASGAPVMDVIRSLYFSDDRTLAAGAAAAALKIHPRDRDASAVLYSCVHAQTFFSFGPFPEPEQGPDLSTVDQFFEPYYQIIYTLTGDPAGLYTDTSELDVLKEKVKDAFSLIQDAYEKALRDLPAQFEGTARLLNEARREQVCTRLAWLLPELHEEFYERARDFVFRALLDPNEPDSMRRSIIQFASVKPEDADRLVEVFLQSAIHTHQSPSVRSLACRMIVFIPDVSKVAVSKARTILTWLAHEDAFDEVREGAHKALDLMSIFSCWKADDIPLSSDTEAAQLSQDARSRLQEIEGLVETLKSDLQSFVESLSETDEDSDEAAS